MKDDQGFVYFMAEKGNPDSDVKIGFSTSLKDRLFALQTGNSKELEIRYVIENVPMSFETYMHEICYRYRGLGEWFKKDVMSFLLERNSPWFKEHIVRFVKSRYVT